MKLAHVSEVPICKISDALSIEMIKSSLLYPHFISLSDTLNELEPYQHLYLTDFCPEEPRNRYQEP